MFIHIIAAGCGHLLRGTGYGHGHSLEGEMDDVLRIIRELHEHGLDVMLAHTKKVPTAMLVGKEWIDRPDAVRIYVVDVNWLELA